MISFKQFLIREDVFSKDGEVVAAVNAASTPRASTDKAISTNRPARLRSNTGYTRGDPVYYAFSYISSDESTKLLSSLKGKGPYSMDDLKRHKFLEETAAYIAQHLKALKPDVITAPRSSSNLLHEFADLLSRKLGIEEVHLNAYRKSDHKLPEDREEALEYIKKHFIDHAYIEAKWAGDPKEAEERTAKSVYSSAKRNDGVVTAKGLDKATAKFVKGIFDVDELEDTLDGKNVLVVDDVLSSGTSMSNLFQVAKDLGAAKVFGAVIFSRTSPSK